MGLARSAAVSRRPKLRLATSVGSGLTPQLAPSPISNLELSQEAVRCSGAPSIRGIHPLPATRPREDAEQRAVKPGNLRTAAAIDAVLVLRAKQTART